MRKIAFKVSYDGTRYHGFQRQPNLPTIQGELEKALSKLAGRPTAVVGSGRTDAGVHACGQIVHFETELSIPVKKWPLAIKHYLPEDIVVVGAYEVASDFHARYDAVGKSYLYIVDRGRIPNVFMRRYSYHYPYPLDLRKIEEAIPHLTGTHDFTAFSASACPVENRIRTLHGIEMEEKGQFLRFTFRGSGFLYNMVRILTGTLLEVGSGKISPHTVAEILQSRNRARAGSTVPPQGLYLLKVDYPPGKGIDERDTTDSGVFFLT